MSRNISFVKTAEELSGIKNNSSLYVQKKELNFAWYIDKNVYEKLLPPGLNPIEPIVCGFISIFEKPGLSFAPYAEAALFLICEYDGMEGGYCLAMPVHGKNEMGVFQGREFLGYPKKCANIEFYRWGDVIEASIERNGIRFFEIRALINEKNREDYEQFFPSPNLNEDVQSSAFLLEYSAHMYGYDSPSTQNLDFTNINLLAQNNIEQYHEYEPCRIEVSFKESEDDPWIEVKPTEIIGGNYCIRSTDMYGAKVLKTYSDEEKESIVPYLFTRYDGTIFGKGHEIWK